MTIDELVACGEALERPCLHLVEAGHGSAGNAFWGGKNPELGNEHNLILSLDFQLLEKVGLNVSRKFALTKWKNNQGDADVRAQPVKPDFFKGVRGAEPLVWSEAKSFPPFPALCLSGGDSIAAWLKEMGLNRWDYDKVAREWEEGYNDTYQARTALYSAPDVYVQIGGWHAQWPEDDYYLPSEMTLLCWTLKDAEPWYEIFQAPQGNIVVKERIT